MSHFRAGSQTPSPGVASDAGSPSHVLAEHVAELDIGPAEPAAASGGNTPTAVESPSRFQSATAGGQGIVRPTPIRPVAGPGAGGAVLVTTDSDSDDSHHTGSVAESPEATRAARRLYVFYH